MRFVNIWQRFKKGVEKVREVKWEDATRAQRRAHVGKIKRDQRKATTSYLRAQRIVAYKQANLAAQERVLAIDTTLIEDEKKRWSVVNMQRNILAARAAAQTR